MLIFDLESNGFLEKMDRIHCICIWDGREMHKFRPEEAAVGVRMLQNAIDNDDPICGHNIIKFDIPAIQKVFPWFTIPKEKRGLVIDTLVLSRLIYPDLDPTDAALFKQGRIPGKLFGLHKLEAWGYRLGVLKGTYGHDTEDPWAVFTPEMLDYNEQDVVVTQRLYEKLSEKNYPATAIRLEHDVAWLLAQQERNGVYFDTNKAQQLEMTLRGQLANLDLKLQQMAPPIPDKVFVPKRDNKAKGYVAGVPIQRYKKEYNPGSYQQTEWIIRKHFGYSPLNEELYDIPKGFKVDGDNYLQFRLKIDEETIRFLKVDDDTPAGLRAFVEVLEPYLMVAKRLGQVADGKEAWLKHVKEDGRIHGAVNPNGAVTGRASHSHPNLAQVPKVSKTKAGIQYGLDGKFGWECRELFGPHPGWVQVGVDACGLELRCLAHFMAPYDNGAYADVVVNGDVHTLNQQAAGLEKRDDAKTFIYAFLKQLRLIAGML